MGKGSRYNVKAPALGGGATAGGLLRVPSRFPFLPQTGRNTNYSFGPHLPPRNACGAGPARTQKSQNVVFAHTSLPKCLWRGVRLETQKTQTWFSPPPSLPKCHWRGVRLDTQKTQTWFSLTPPRPKCRGRGAQLEHEETQVWFPPTPCMSSRASGQRPRNTNMNCACFRLHFPFRNAVGAGSSSSTKKHKCGFRPRPAWSSRASGQRPRNTIMDFACTSHYCTAWGGTRPRAVPSCHGLQQKHSNVGSAGNVYDIKADCPISSQAQAVAGGGPTECPRPAPSPGLGPARSKGQSATRNTGRGGKYAAPMRT